MFAAVAGRVRRPKPPLKREPTAPATSNKSLMICSLGTALGQPLVYPLHPLLVFVVIIRSILAV